MDKAQQKQELRRAALANRVAQQDKDELSRRIVARLLSLPEFATANTILFYVDVREEVRTRHGLLSALDSGKRLAVPFCVDNDLQLFHLASMDELEAGRYEIPEPKQELRSLSQKQINPEEVDLIVVPGVAFDRRGGRLGHGKGYYDRLLRRAQREATVVALAFECQMVAEVPMEAHDIRMHKIITEQADYEVSNARSK